MKIPGHFLATINSQGGILPNCYVGESGCCKTYAGTIDDVIIAVGVNASIAADSDVPKTKHLAVRFSFGISRDGCAFPLGNG